MCQTKIRSSEKSHKKDYIKKDYSNFVWEQLNILEKFWSPPPSSKSLILRLFPVVISLIGPQCLRNTEAEKFHNLDAFINPPDAQKEFRHSSISTLIFMNFYKLFSQLFLTVIKVSMFA